MLEEGIAIDVSRHVADAQHIFTHLLWSIRMLAAAGIEEERLGELPSYQWVGPEEFESYVWPNVFRKLLTDYFIHH